ncbi:lipid-A-disaccharide synthase [Xanthobacteraceae bacterium Astr-EGSB]|uniref:lipid-A-disaccharide synthase n=1 Tax=Astrobacterium formosum TaxID=3069710 RepID=UPI0027B497B5|nr:lipid-A-disaccharide synthase [Xanthobacteraceae bacterium Astr-EGSB]
MSRAGPLRVFVIAGETSGDHLGAPLMRSLAARDDVRFQGIGGEEMAAAGLESLFPIDELAIMGFSAIPAKLPLILRRIRQAADAVVAAKPDVLVIIDSPDFTHRVARRVRKALPQLPVVDYVSPSVWAWRPGRARAMRRYVDHVLALLPFEPESHARLGGPPCTYVGHPLVEQVAKLRPNADEARRRAADPPRLLVLPGSRSGEIARHLDLFGATVARCVEAIGPVEAVLPTLPHLAARIEAATATWPVAPKLIVETDEKWQAFRTARAALAASGTVTLELALAGIPTVVAYRVSLMEEAIVKPLLRVPSIVLANLVLGDNVMPEILQRQATPERLARELAQVVTDTPERRRQVDGLARIDQVMDIGAAQPSVRAAEVILKVVGRSA